MRKNIAGQVVGAQLVSATDGSAFTGSVTAYITGDGGTQAAGSVGSGACTHEGNGYHTYAPAQAETNYDLVAVTFIGTGAVPVTVQIYTRPTTGILAPTTADRTLDVTATGAAGIDWGNVENQSTSVDLSATAINLCDTVTTNTDLVSAAAIRAEIDSNSTQLAAILLDTGTTLPSTLTAIQGATFDTATDSLEAIRDRGDSAWITATGFPSASAIADAVWDEPGADHVTSGTTGEAQFFTDDNVTTLLTSVSALPSASANATAVWAAATRTLTAGTNIGFPTAGAIADAVWDEVITGAEHNVNNSSAKFLRQSGQAITGVTGTLQSATSTTAVLASGAVSADDILNGQRITIIEGTGVGQSRIITDSVASTDTVTVGHAWTTNPDNTSIYAIMGAEVDVRAVAEQPVNATALVDYDDLATIEAVTTAIGATGTGLSAIPWNAAWDAEVQSECTDAINALFTFTVSGQVDANIQSINDTAIVGNGVSPKFGV